MTTAGDPAPMFDRLARREAAGGRLRFALVVAAAAQLLSFVLYGQLWSAPQERFRDTFAVLCRDPFTHAPVGEPQARHRVLGPILAYAVDLRGENGQAVLYAAVFAFLVLFYLTARRWWDCESSTLLTLLIATTPVVTTSQTWLGYPDILAHLAVLGCMAVRSSWATGPILFVGMLADERAVAAAPLAALWHVAVGTDPRPARGFVVRGVAAAAALAAWVVFYRWVQAEYVRDMIAYNNNEFMRSHLSGEVAARDLAALPGGAYYALRTAWLLPILFFAAAAAGPGYRLMAAAAAAAATAAALPGVIVADHSRCIAGCWPVVLVATVYVRKLFPASFRDLLFGAVLMNVFTPMYDVVGPGFQLRITVPGSAVRASLAP